MGAPGPLDRKAVYFLRTGPTLRRPQDDHRPARTGGYPAFTRTVLYFLDRVERVVEGGGELLVNGDWFVPGDDERIPAVALEERHELFLGDAGEDRRVCDLVAIQVQDRQHGAVGTRIQELGRMPARGERARLGLSVADNAGDDQVGVVECSAERMRERVAELAAFVDRAGRLGRGVARDSARKRELAEQLPQALFVLRHMRIELAVRAFEVGIRDDSRATMAWTRDVDRVQVAGADCAVDVDVDKVEARRRAEVTEQPRLHVLRPQRLAQERVVEQVDLPDREVVGRAPVRVEQPQLLPRDRAGRNGGGFGTRAHARRRSKITRTLSCS